VPATRPAPRDRRDISPGRADVRKRSRLIRERVRYRWIGYQRTLSRVRSVQQRSEGLGLNSELRSSVAKLSRRSDRLATVRSNQARPSTPSQRPREPSVEAARCDATRALFPGHSIRHGTGSTPSRNRRAPPRSPRFRQRRQIADGNRMICRAFLSPLTDSNRRPLPYHKGGRQPRITVRKQGFLTIPAPLSVARSPWITRRFPSIWPQILTSVAGGPTTGYGSG